LLVHLSLSTLLHFAHFPFFFNLRSATLLTSLLTKNQPLVAVDFHNNEISILQLTKKTHSHFLNKLKNVALPLGSIQAGKIHNPNLIQTELAKIVAELDLLGVAAAIALPTKIVITKKIKLPAGLNEEECEAEIISNLNQFFPGLTEQLSFDFTLVKTTPNVDEILLTAVRKPDMQLYVDIVEQAGLEVKVVDVDAYALARAVSHAQPALAKVACCIIRIDTGYAQIIVLKHAQVVFTQSWYANDDALEIHIKRALHLCQATVLDHHTIVDFILLGKIPESFFLYSNTSLHMHQANPFQAMHMTSDLVSISEKLYAKFLVCCGLSLRKIQQW
jgi:type IV pilus assembly protein PilM